MLTTATNQTNSFLIWLACCLILIGSCGHASRKATVRDPETYISDPNSIGFAIESLPRGDAAARWLAVYTSKGRTAKFQIELESSTPLSDEESKRFSIESGKGKLLAVPGSDATVILADLRTALEAKNLPTKVQRVDSLPFDFVTFGHNKSQVAGGGFADSPAGNWTPMKIFLGEGDDEGEVFLSLNPTNKKGQFLIKDQEYGDIVLAQLAKVL